MTAPQPAISPADIARVIEAAEHTDQMLTPAIAAGVAIMDRLDPETYAKLAALIDADRV